MGVADEVWWSRLASPTLHAWTDRAPRRLVPHEADRQDLAPKALACDGCLRADTQAMRRRVGDGRPVRAVTTPCLAWLTACLAHEHTHALLLVWDQASWHISRDGRTWIRTHHQPVKRAGGCRLVVCQLPTKSPGLNRIEPTGVHGKRAMAEPARNLTVEDTQQRICASDHCELVAPLAQKTA